MIIYYVIHKICWVLALILFRLTRKGVENIPLEGPVILASNHLSFLDPLVIPIACKRQLFFMAKSELFTVPFLGWLMKKFKAFPIKRDGIDRSSLKNSIAVLKEGKALLVFPEGTRSQTGEIQDPKPGIGFLAYHSQAPVVPTLVIGAEKALPRDTYIIRPKKIKVIFGTPLTFSKFYSEEQSKDIYRKIGEEIIEAIKKLKRDET